MKSKENSGNKIGRTLCSGLQKRSLFRIIRLYLDFLVKPIFFFSQYFYKIEEKSSFYGLICDFSI